jgi:hypothetical protein
LVNEQTPADPLAAGGQLHSAKRWTVTAPCVYTFPLLRTQRSQSAHCTTFWTTLTMATHALAALLLAISAFAATFAVVMRLSATHVKVFRDFSRAEQGDWGSR